MKFYLVLFFSLCLVASGCSSVSSKTSSNSDKQTSSSEYKSKKPSKGAESMFTDISTTGFLLGLAALVIVYGKNKNNN